jgi:hydrogenase nickel incorporation protein HypA/HybF
MHEQSIVESILALALDNARKADANKILKIHLVVGELSGVLDQSVGFYFGFLSRNTIASQASICFKHVPAQLLCRTCNMVFLPQRLDFHCPICKEQQVEIVAGRELYVDSLEVE